MLGGSAMASWWDGQHQLDGTRNYEVPKISGVKESDDAAKEEMFSHLSLRPRHNPEWRANANRKRTDLMAYNDGCAAIYLPAPPPCPSSLSPIDVSLWSRARVLRERRSALSANSIDKPVSMHAQAGGPRMRQAGSLRMDDYDHGQFDQQSGWRSGDDGGFTIDGSEAANYSKVPTGDLQHQAAWRFGDTAAFSFDESGPSASEQSPPHLRKGGVGRKVHPSILPHNDGSQLGMQRSLVDIANRERRDARAYQLVSNSGGLSVEDVPRDERTKARLDKLVMGDQQATWREHLWDSKPFALDCSDRPEHMHPANPTRKRTDVTFTQHSGAADMNKGAAARMQSQADQVARTTTQWRAGDDLPFTLDGAPARQHNNHLDPNQGMWRLGDTRPFRIDGSVPDDDRASTRAANPDLNARRHTDVMYHRDPNNMSDMRHLAQLGVLGSEAQGGTIDELYNGAAQKRFGPLADIVNTGSRVDVNSGLSWGEMRRRGHMLQSKSEASLPARTTTGFA